MLKKSDKKFIIRVLLLIIIGIIIVVKIDVLGAFISSFFSLLAPLFVGILLALFLNRPVEFFQKQFRKIHYFNNQRAKIPAVIISYLLTLGIIISLFLIMIPQLIDSFAEFISNFDSYSRTFTSTVDQASEWVEQYNIDPILISNFSNRGLEFITTLLQSLPAILSKVVSGLVSIVAAFSLGVIISIYIMFDKKRIKRQFLRTIAAFTPVKSHVQFLHIANIVQMNFSTYIYTQVTEGLILGILFFIGTSILGFPYALIISVINGLSVLIPIVGAWVGAVGGGIIVLFAKPDMIVTYLIFVVVMQMIENNLIYPRRMTDSVGLPQIWVLVAITLGGGLFGILGALLAVPVASIAYQLLSESVSKKEQVRRLENNRKTMEDGQILDDVNKSSEEKELE